jgi:CheY-like chemotaxis protein
VKRRRLSSAPCRSSRSGRPIGSLRTPKTRFQPFFHQKTTQEPPKNHPRTTQEPPKNHHFHRWIGLVWLVEKRKIILSVPPQAEEPAIEPIRQALAAACPGLDVVEVNYGLNLVEEVRKIQPELILFDLSEDTENCLNTIRTVRQQSCDLPVFALMDGTSFEFEREMLRLGIRTVFPRENEIESLVRNIKTLLEDM